nr:hypothetical protein [Tanacetum cinerariifolium]
MILESFENGPLIWHTIEENEVTRLKKYSQLSAAEATQYGPPYQSSTPLSITYPSNDYQSSIYHNVYSPPPYIPQLEYAPIVTQQQQQYEFPPLDSDLTILVFKQGDDPIDAISHVMSFISAVILEGQATQMVITHNVAYQADDLGAYDSNCDEFNTTKVALMANLSQYGSYVLAKVHIPDNMDNSMINQGVQVLMTPEQSSVVNQSETEITSDSDIISYSR